MALNSSIPTVPPLLGSGFDFAWRQATEAGVATVIALLVLSSFSWAVMVTKLLSLARLAKANRLFLSTIARHGARPLPADVDMLGMEASPLLKAYQDGRKEMASATSSTTEGAMERVSLALQGAIGDAVLKLESQTPLLATVVSGGPFLGLLGTVWGVMDAFSGIAQAEQSAGIKDLAPGVAAALVTTVVGLLVAIPAMFGYNYLMAKTRAIIVQMDNFAAQLLLAFRKELEGGNNS